MNDQILSQILKLHRVEYLIIDRALTILEVSANLSDFSETPEAIAIGQDIQSCFPELVGYESQLEAICEQQQADLTLQGIYRSTAKHHLLYLDLRIQRYGDRLHSEDQLLVLVEDVSEKMILEQQLVQRANETELLLQKLTEQNAALEKAKYAADAANRAKSAFLAMMSHEIRTPMNGVIGAAELLLNSGLAPHPHQLVEMINGSGQALLSIINDILDFSKIEAGAIELETQPFNLRDCIRNAIGLLANQVEAKNIELAFIDKLTLPSVIVGDITRLRQVLINLIGNAIKFTEAGEVTVSATVRSQIDDRYEIEFAVRDSGIGIPSDRLNSLFEEFSQVDASITRKYGGTGLGLAISKRLCKLMGGKIWVESQLGQGSTFYFTIAAAVASEAIDRSSIQPLQTPQPQPFKILLAEDHPINQQLMLLMLAQLGYQADLANDGLEVLAALRSQPYDVILMDVQMPELDGIATVEQIDREWKAADRPQIIALTASAMEEDRQRCLQVGMSEYMTKPVRLEELAQVLSRCRSRCDHPVSDSPKLSPLIDSEALQQIRLATRHSATFVVEIIDLYFREAPKLIAKMKDSFHLDDCKTFRRAVHTLHGCSASIGAIHLSEQCRVLEEIAYNTGLVDLIDRVVEIETAYQDVQAALQQERQKYASA